MITFLIVAFVCSVLLVAYFVFSRQRERENIEINKRFDEYISCLQNNVKSISKLSLAGIDEDANSDFQFSEAVKRIILSDDIRVKLHEEE